MSAITRNDDNKIVTRCPVCGRGDIVDTHRDGGLSLMGHLAWHADGMPIQGKASGATTGAFVRMIRALGGEV